VLRNDRADRHLPEHFLPGILQDACWELFMDVTDQVLLDFINEIDTAVDLDGHFVALEKAATALGFENVSYTYVPSVLGNSLQQYAPVFKLSRSYNMAFIEHYTQEMFAQHDFTIKRIRAGDLRPMNWWEEADQKALSDSEKHVIEVARQDYGIRNGLSLPTFSDGASIAGVSVTSPDSDHQFQLLYGERRDTMRKIARIFSDRILVMPQNRASFLLPMLERMSKTEKLLLQKLSQDKTLNVAASELGIGQRYASNLVEGLRNKLGNISREQLLYIAGMLEFSKLL
jgi:hypothetical protein